MENLNEETDEKKKERMMIKYKTSPGSFPPNFPRPATQALETGHTINRNKAIK